MRGGEPAGGSPRRCPAAHRALSHKYWIDELYDEIVVGPVDTIADAAVWIDRWLVDGVIAGFTSGVVRVVGTVLRLLQTGRVRSTRARW
jgi:NADH-quinone oxidoreductase subunit L